MAKGHPQTAEAEAAVLAEFHQAAREYKSPEPPPAPAVRKEALRGELGKARTPAERGAIESEIAAIERAEHNGLDPNMPRLPIVTHDGTESLSRMDGHDAAQMIGHLNELGMTTNDPVSQAFIAGEPVISAEDQAIARRQRESLMGDPAWVEKYMRGDPTATLQMLNLNAKLISGVKT
jgi:hypothetical protein